MTHKINTVQREVTGFFGLVGISLVFFIGGVFLGPFNALRMSGLINFPEIHYIHWNTALLGGVTFILLLQFFVFVNLTVGVPKYFPLGIFAIWLLAILINYLTIFNLVSPVVPKILFVSVAILLLYIDYRLLKLPYIQPSEGLHLYFVAGTFWLMIGIINFESLFYMNSLFLFSYVYGFFTNFLFGGLFFFVPILYSQKSPSLTSIKLHNGFLNLGIIFGFIFEYSKKQGGIEFGWALDLVSTVFWFLAFAIFFFWFADLIYKAGLSVSIFGLIVGMIMYGLFLFDSFVGAILPAWVGLRHVHLMFVGVFVITISSIGLKIIRIESGRENNETIDWDFQTLKTINKVKAVLLSFVILGVAGVLFSFTIQDYLWLAYSGFFLIIFFSINIFYVILNS